ncbi:hypothetical protein M9434_004123 [Picochlorum sp. BPE23]|nr:hypothetical protein M9434_004123 [Picochlorum sp. BPE23]
MMREHSGQGGLATTRVVATHAVPDKSIIDLAYDLSHLDDTNIWPSQAEMIVPEGEVMDEFVQRSILDWMDHGCHASIVPLDGRDGDQMEWMVSMIESVARGMMVRKVKRATRVGSGSRQSASGELKVGIVWKRADGQDSDAIIGRSRNSSGSSSGTSTHGLQDAWPRAVVQVGSAVSGGGNEDDERRASESIGHVMQFLIDSKRKRIREDSVVSLVMYDEGDCVFAMLHFVVARTRTSFTNMVSLIEEIGALHSRKKAGDYVLKSAQYSPLNMIAAPIVGGNTKLFIAPYSKGDGDDMSFVSSILSVCSSSQTLRTDIIWCDAYSSVPSIPATGSPQQSAYTPASDWITVDVDGQRETTTKSLQTAPFLQSPSIESMKESLKLRSSQTLNEAVKSAMKQMAKEESPTLAARLGHEQPGDDVHEKRTLEFPSLRSSWNSNGDVHGRRNPLGRSLFGGSFRKAPWKPTREFSPHRISRDVFSNIPSAEDARQESKTSLSLNNNVSTQADSGDDGVPEFVESEYLVHSATPSKASDDHADAPCSCEEKEEEPASCDVRDEVRLEIERHVNEKLLETIQELERKLEWSEIQRFQLEHSNQTSEDVILQDMECHDATSMLKALREERKSSKKMEQEVSSAKHDKLALEVEIASKDKEISLLRARVHALENQSDLSVAFKLCEDTLESAQEEARRLRCENTHLSEQLMTLEVSNMLSSYAPILPQDEDYDVDSAEGRIIYELSEKVKSMQQQLAKVEQQKEDTMQQLEQCQRQARSVHVNKKMANEALRRASLLQKKLDTVQEEARRQGLAMADTIAMYEERMQQQHMAYALPHQQPTNGITV